MNVIVYIIIGIVAVRYIIKSFNSNQNNDKQLLVIKKVDTKVKDKNKSNRTWGKFDVAGFHHLPEETKTLIWKDLKVGDDLLLVPVTDNEFDKTAIKVMFKETQIGWFPMYHNRKQEVYDILLKKNNIVVYCTNNYRKGDYIRASRPDSEGNWNHKYLGMTQFVEAKFQYDFL
jgi:hypothetical protein